MGGLKSWFKRATKIPKSIKKIKVGNVLKSVVTGTNPISAVAGELDRIKQEKEAQKAAAEAQAEVDRAAQGVPVYAPGTPAETKPPDTQTFPGVPVIPGVEVSSTRTFVVIGAIVGVGALMFLAMRRR